MTTDDIFVANTEGESKFIIKIKTNPNIFGIIEKEYSKDKTKQVFSIKYYWNKVFQDELYADTLEQAESKLKNILRQALKQVNNIQTFEQFTKYK